MNKILNKPSSIIAVVAGLALFAAIFSGVWSCTQRAAVNTYGIPDCEITQPLDSIFAGLFSDPSDPGAIVMVMRGDSAVFKRCYGTADLETGAPVRDSTVFNISSGTKSYVGAAIMKLAEQGLVSLDDSLSKFFPELPAKYFDKIKVWHVLTHSSGLPDLRPSTPEAWEEYVGSFRSSFGMNSDYRLYGSEREYIRTFQALDTVPYNPGEHFDKRDISYVLIAPLIENVTGCDFRRWMQENIFAPAGMTSTYFFDGSAPGSPRMAHGYRLAPDSVPSGEGSRWDEYDYGEADFFTTKADRGACSTADDYLRFKIALQSGKIISRESLATMLVPILNSGVDNVVWAPATPILQEPGRPAKCYYINTNGGFGVIIGWWPDKDLQYLVFSNRNDWDRRHTAAAVDSVFRANHWLD